MLIRTALLMLCVTFSFSVAATESQTRYYRQLVFRESPIEDIKGRIEIDAKTAQNVLHYRFVYDPQNRLTEVSHRIGQHLTRNIGSFPGFFWFAPKVAIRYEGKREIREFFDETDQPITAHGQVKTMVFTRDEQQRRVSLHHQGADGAAVDNAWGIHRYDWQHPQAGVVIEQRFNVAGAEMTMRPDLLFKKIRMEFGGDDLLDFVFNIDANGNLVNNEHGAAVDRIVYDDQNNFIRWQVYDANRVSVNGNEPQMAMGEYQYDQFGQTRSLRGFTTNGENGTFSWGFHAMKTRYDEFGNPAEQVIVASNGDIQSITRFEFADNGKRVMWIKQFDGKGQPDQSRGFFAMQPQYDEKGRRRGVKTFDINMKEITQPM